MPQLISTECYIHDSKNNMTLNFPPPMQEGGHVGVIAVRCDQAPSGQLGSISHNTIIMCLLHFWQCYAPTELYCIFDTILVEHMQDYISFIYFIHCLNDLNMVKLLHLYYFRRERLYQLMCKSCVCN